MSNVGQYLIYRNRFNEVKCYDVEVVETGETYTRVRDRNEGYAKTFRNENIISSETDLIVATQLAEKIQEQYQLIPRPEVRRLDPDYRQKYNLDGKLEVCFTGFKRTVKNQMIEMAQEANFFVRKSVSNKLDLLVCGDNAGPKKLTTASKMNVAIIRGLNGFQRFIETGEIDE